jgi:hypothetical protein
MIEKTRVSYKPHKVTTLFIGESAPASGKFFYLGNTSMYRNMKTAFESAFGESKDFLKSFKANGWYLDDLVLKPVNEQGRLERKANCLKSGKNLAKRISRYRPQTIVILGRGIERYIKPAMEEAKYNKLHHTVCFPGNGQQANFRREMKLIIAKLPSALKVKKKRKAKK